MTTRHSTAVNRYKVFTLFTSLIIVLCNHKWNLVREFTIPTWMHPPVSLEVFGTFQVSSLSHLPNGPFLNRGTRSRAFSLPNQILSDASCIINRLGISTFFPFTHSLSFQAKIFSSSWKVGGVESSFRFCLANKVTLSASRLVNLKEETLFCKGIWF